MNNGQEPATKLDVAQLRSEVKQDIAQFRAEVKQDVAQLRSEMSHQNDDLNETIRDTETNLLKAFYTFAESNQTRLATIETDSDAVKKRVGILEERVLQLERKVNFPGQPQQ